MPQIWETVAVPRGKRGPPKRTHCHKGHEFAGRNVRLDRRGIRICRECKRIDSAQRRADGKGRSVVKRKDDRLRAKYGMTLRDKLALYEGQARTCGICKQTFAEADLKVDHDHASGEVRGLLCSLCNTGLGQFKDSVERLLAAAEYLKCR